MWLLGAGSVGGHLFCSQSTSEPVQVKLCQSNLKQWKHAENMEICEKWFDALMLRRWHQICVELRGDFLKLTLLLASYYLLDYFFVTGGKKKPQRSLKTLEKQFSIFSTLIYIYMFKNRKFSDAKSHSCLTTFYLNYLDAKRLVGWIGVCDGALRHIKHNEVSFFCPWVHHHVGL